jgi:hypothetical protein
MTATLHDDVLDGALNIIKNNTENLYICKTAQPTTFAEASSTYAVGVKATPTFTGPANGASGRSLTVDAITDGTVSGSGTAGWYALTDDSASKLLAAYELNATQVVTSGNTFTLTAIVINLPDPV